MENINKVEGNNLNILLKEVEKTHKEYKKSILKLEKNLSSEIEKSLKGINNFLRVKYKSELEVIPSHVSGLISMKINFIGGTKGDNNINTFIEDAFYDNFSNDDEQDRIYGTILEITNFLLTKNLFKDSQKMKSNNLMFDMDRSDDEFEFDSIEDLDDHIETKELKDKLNKLLIPHINGINKILEKFAEIGHDFELKTNGENSDID